MKNIFAHRKRNTSVQGNQTANKCYYCSLMSMNSIHTLTLSIKCIRTLMIQSVYSYPSKYFLFDIRSQFIYIWF